MPRRVIGQSVNGADIEAVRFGTGQTAVAIIGGIHGSFESNTVVLAERFIDMLTSAHHLDLIPPTVSIHIIPNMNPDGYAKHGYIGRVNARKVDLNRNWDCNWKNYDGRYRGYEYRTGWGPFSEPETRAVNEFLLEIVPKAVIFYHSSGAFIFYGTCQPPNNVPPNSTQRQDTPTETISYALAQQVSAATGYPIYNPPSSMGDPNTTITGDATDYLDSIGIPAIGIELTEHGHDVIDWAENLAALNALIAFAKQSTVEPADSAESVAEDDTLHDWLREFELLWYEQSK